MQGYTGFAAALAIGWAAIAAPAPARAMEPPAAAESRQEDGYQRAAKLIEGKQYAKAIALLDAVLKKNPGHADALNALGFSHRKLGDYGRAVAFYKQALEVAPDHRGANEYLGEAYLELKNLPGAEERLARLQAICGDGCEETRALTKAITAFKSGKPMEQSSRRW